MSILLRLALAVPLLLTCPARAETEQVGKQAETAALPVELVRTLQALQDQIAAGSTNAHVAQRALLTHIDERLMPLGAEIWHEPRNVRAAVVYVLSGGKPDLLRRILSIGSISAPQDALVKGALAYVEGREAEAQKLLEGIDPHTLPATLSGQIALVQAALNVRDNPAKSIELLDFARLQLPGTLVEEAALRREIFVVSQIGDTKKFDSLSRQYLRRFRYSVYSGNFRQRFAVALTRLEFARDPNFFSRLVTMLGELEPAGRLELYLMVARAAINQGQTHAAIMASDKARELSAEDNVSAARARLYHAAAIIVTAQGFDEGVSELRKIDRSILPAADITLLESALSMATYIRGNPQEAAAVAMSEPQSDVDAAVHKPTPVISRAQEALGAVDQLVRKGTR